VWPAFLARLSDPGFNPVAENISFEFSKDREHACQRSAAGRGQVERFAQRDEADVQVMRVPAVVNYYTWQRTL
jgi:hypothetical protein